MQDNTTEILPAIRVDLALRDEICRVTQKHETVCQECEKQANKVALLLKLHQQLTDELRVLRGESQGINFRMNHKKR